MIKAIIIEDEVESRKAITTMLSQHFSNINVLAVCENVAAGKKAIETLQPELVFSDVELGEHTIFDMLPQLANINFEIVFTTAYGHYAIQAIKFSALDYLLKPFSITDITEAINRYINKKDKSQSADQLQALFHNLRHIEKDAKKITLPTANGLMIVPIKDIVRCEAADNYTNFFLSAKSKVLVSKTLKEFEELLKEYDFIRIHHSHLINLRHVKNYTRGEGGTVTMTDGSEVDVSRRKKDEFLKQLAAL